MAKWFDPEKQNMVPRRPMILEPMTLTQDKLVELFRIIYDRVSVRTYGLLRRMALYEPHIRLGVNLRSLLDLLQAQRVDDISSGLKTDEIDTLLELEDLELPLSLRATAQSLFNVHERALCIELLKDSFERYRAQRRSKLDIKPLDTD